MNKYLNLLIIDDSASDAEKIVGHLTGEGYSLNYRRVETPASLKSALREENWDIVITDYSMPGISVLQVLAFLDGEHPAIPLIVVSGRAGEEKAVPVLRAGARDFLDKNRLDRLAPVIERELQRSDQPGRIQLDKRPEIIQLQTLAAGAAQAEKALRESEERYRALATSAQMVWTVPGDSGDLDLSAEGSARATTKRLESVGWFDSIHPDDRQKNLSKWEAVIRKKKVFENEIRIKTEGGDFRHFYVRAVPVFNPDDTVREWVGMNFDITERKKAEEELHNSEARLLQIQRLESVGQLAGGIAHDFNNMLTAINGYCDLALRKLDEKDPLHRYIIEIKKSGDRSARLTQQLLAFSRKQVLYPSVVDINQVILDTGGMLRRLIGENISLDTNLHPDIHPVKVDPGQLSQVIMNLTVNARDAMPEGGRLLIETSNVYFDDLYRDIHFGAKVGEYVMLAVSDTGVGIEKEIQKKIFEPFFTTKSVTKGTGLGLSTVYGIVKQSGGYIWVYSDVGVGTTFKIYFPQVREKVEMIPDPDPIQLVKKGRETILLVEDESTVRNLCRQVLESSGYRVFEAENGVDALEIFSRNRAEIDLLITDVVMPEMGGRVLAQKVNQIRPDLPVLFMSGYTDDTVIRNGVLEEDMNYLQKPFNTNTLTQTIRNSLDNEIKKD